MAADAQLTTSRRLVRLHPVWPAVSSLEEMLWRFGTIGACCQRRCHLLLKHTLRGFHQSAFWKMLCFMETVKKILRKKLLLIGNEVCTMA